MIVANRLGLTKDGVTKLFMCVDHHTFFALENYYTKSLDPETVAYLFARVFENSMKVKLMSGMNQHITKIEIGAKAVPMDVDGERHFLYLVYATLDIDLETYSRLRRKAGDGDKDPFPGYQSLES